jgi:hypothetical protein
MPYPRVSKCRAQHIDMIDEKPKPPVLKVHGEEITAARDKVAAIARHRPIMGFAWRSTHPTIQSQNKRLTA